VKRLLRDEYRHRPTKKCSRRGWHDFCEAVDTLAVEYTMRTVPSRNEPHLIVAAALVDSDSWLLDDGRGALAMGRRIEARLDAAGLLR